MEARTDRSGWTQQETDQLMEQARIAQEEGRSLREVFEQTAFSTGRKPNSIRNYYYSHNRESGAARRERFTPFAADEAENLTALILSARAQGESVRACVTRLAKGDQKLMLRYQNKYRALLKNRPDIIQNTIERLRAQGIEPPSPYHSTSARSAGQAWEQLSASKVNDRRICDMIDTLGKLVRMYETDAGRLQSAAWSMVECIKGFIGKGEAERESGWGEFICELVKLTKCMEQSLPQNSTYVTAGKATRV